MTHFLMIKEIQTLYLRNLDQNIKIHFYFYFEKKILSFRKLQTYLILSLIWIWVREQYCDIKNFIRYKYAGYKIKPKNDIDDQVIKLNWCNRLFFDNWNNIFFADETTIYLNNPGGFKWINEDIQQNFITGGNRGRKVKVWWAINWKGKWTQHIFEENLDTKKYLKNLLICYLKW